jgi:four helix bundle protein
MSILKEKSFELAVRIVNLGKYLRGEHKEFVLSNQIVRSGTSVGANVREAQNGESAADFIHKLGIAQKECDETRYWLELLYATDYLNKAEFDSIHDDATQVFKMITKSIVTKKGNK